MEEVEPSLEEMKAWLKKRKLLGKGKLTKDRITRRY